MLSLIPSPLLLPILYTKFPSGQCLLLRSLDKLVAALNRAVTNNKHHRIATIFLDISVLHFKDGLNPRNYADLSQSPFPFPVLPAAALAPPGGIAAPTGSLPVTDIFNYAALPSDV